MLLHQMITICVVFLLLTMPLTFFYVILYAAGEFIYMGPKMALSKAFVL